MAALPSPFDEFEDELATVRRFCGSVGQLAHLTIAPCSPPFTPAPCPPECPPAPALALPVSRLARRPRVPVAPEVPAAAVRTVPLEACPPPFTPAAGLHVCPPEVALATRTGMVGRLTLRRQQHSAPRVFVGAEAAALRVTPLAVADIPVGATFMNIPCAPVCPADPDLAPATCQAPLGLFQLAINCLGAPDTLSLAARRVAAARRRH